MVGAEGELVGERVSAWHFCCCWMHTDGQKAGERGEPRALHREQGAQISCRKPAGVGLIWWLQGWLLQGMGRAERGKEGRNERWKEGSPFIAASSEMQGGCQCVSMPGGEEWMWFSFIRHSGICCGKHDWWRGHGFWPICKWRAQWWRAF